MNPHDALLRRLPDVVFRAHQVLDFVVDGDSIVVDERLTR